MKNSSFERRIFPEKRTFIFKATSPGRKRIFLPLLFAFHLARIRFSRICTYQLELFSWIQLFQLARSQQQQGWWWILAAGGIIFFESTNTNKQTSTNIQSAEEESHTKNECFALACFSCFDDKQIQTHGERNRILTRIQRCRKDDHSESAAQSKLNWAAGQDHAMPKTHRIQSNQPESKHTQNSRILAWTDDDYAKTRPRERTESSPSAQTHKDSKDPLSHTLVWRYLTGIQLNQKQGKADELLNPLFGAIWEACVRAKDWSPTRLQFRSVKAELAGRFETFVISWPFSTPQPPTIGKGKEEEKVELNLFTQMIYPKLTDERGRGGGNRDRFERGGKRGV